MVELSTAQERNEVVRRDLCDWISSREKDQRALVISAPDVASKLGDLTSASHHLGSPYA